jgi:MoaA/NifB/PqqE/SkfB family radical SAM enzyme
LALSRFLYNYRYGAHWHKPKLLYRIASSYAKLALSDAHPLRYVDVNVGLGCNLTCEHCFAENLKTSDGEELNKAEWQSVIDQCIDLGAISVGFTGGEPLAYAKLEQMIEMAHPDRMLIIIVSNGTLLTPERARSLKDAGADVMLISLDSGIREEHDAFRGKQGAFDLAMRAFDVARDAGLKVAAVPTVSHDNIHSEGFERIIDWGAREKLLVILSYAAPSGNWSGKLEFLLTPEDCAHLDQLIKRNPHVRRDFETNYWTLGCGAGNEKLYFTPTGDVIPCPYMHISFGNVREDSVAEIRGRMLANPYLEGFHPRCLVAEETEFIQRFLPRTSLTGLTLPRSEQVFPADEER